MQAKMLWLWINRKVFFFLRNGKIYCKEKHHIEKAKGRGETNPSQSNPQSLPKDITIQRWLVTPFNILVITQTNSMMQIVDFIKGF